jgi:hypothetical protein
LGVSGVRDGHGIDSLGTLILYSVIGSIGETMKKCNNNYFLSMGTDSLDNLIAFVCASV